MARLSISVLLLISALATPAAAIEMSTNYGNGEYYRPIRYFEYGEYYMPPVPKGHPHPRVRATYGPARNYHGGAFGRHSRHYPHVHNQRPAAQPCVECSQPAAPHYEAYGPDLILPEGDEPSVLEHDAPPAPPTDFVRQRAEFGPTAAALFPAGS